MGGNHSGTIGAAAPVAPAVDAPADEREIGAVGQYAPAEAQTPWEWLTYDRDYFWYMETAGHPANFFATGYTPTPEESMGDFEPLSPEGTRERPLVVSSDEEPAAAEPEQDWWFDGPDVVYGGGHGMGDPFAEEYAPLPEILVDGMPAAEVPAAEMPMEEAPAAVIPPAAAAPGADVPVIVVPIAGLPAILLLIAQAPAMEMPVDQMPEWEVPAAAAPVVEVPAAEPQMEVEIETDSESGITSIDED